MSSLSRPLRRAAGRVLRNSKAFRDTTKRLDRAESRLDRAADDLARQRKRLDESRDQWTRHRTASDKRLDKMEAALKPLSEFLRPVEQAHALRELDQQRLLSQVAVFEERLGRLEQLAVTPGGPADGAVPAADPTATGDPDLGQARALLDQIRTEHERIRARMQVVAWYEERLRRVESSVTALYSGDARHPV